MSYWEVNTEKPKSLKGVPRYLKVIKIYIVFKNTINLIILKIKEH